MHKGFLQLSAILGALSVAFGAFGAHALKKLANESIVNIFETGVRYQFYHVFALALVGILFHDYSNKYMLWAGSLFVAGILLLSGSLYALTLIKTLQKTGMDWIGIVTPFGGLAFIAGWVCIVIGIFKNG